MYPSKYGTARHIWHRHPQGRECKPRGQRLDPCRRRREDQQRRRAAATTSRTCPRRFDGQQHDLGLLAHRDGDAGGADHRDGLRLGDKAVDDTGFSIETQAAPARSMWVDLSMACELA